MSGSVRRQITEIVQRHTAPEALSRGLARFARQRRDGAIRDGDAPPSYTTFVDGARGADEESVKPGGVISYRFDQMADAVAFLKVYLPQRSPQNSDAKNPARYRDSFVVAFNGQTLALADVTPELLAGVTSVWIYNAQLYGRKVDVQSIGQKPLRFTVPPFILRDAETAVRERFPNIYAKRHYDLPRSVAGTFGFERTTRTTLSPGKKNYQPIEHPALNLQTRRGRST